MNKINLLLAAGGTGGHLFPGISVVESIISIIGRGKISILACGKEDKIEFQITQKKEWQFVSIPMRGFPGFSLKLFPFIYNTIRSVNLCRKIIWENHIDLTVATGAYISYPVGIATKLENKPLFLIEPNIFPGSANRLLSTKADIIFLGYEETKQWLPKTALNRCQTIGVPIRAEFASLLSKEEACKKFSLDPKKKTLLVFGGSLGAKSINLNLEQIYRNLLNKGIQIIWQTGKNFQTNIQPNESLLILQFIEDMPTALACADLVVCRAGASTIAELSASAKPAIFVPYPYAKNRHQEVNARQLEKNSAGVLLFDNQLAIGLEKTILSLIFDEDQLAMLSANISKYSNINASKTIANEILKHIGF
ncbi:MAG: UDP-N-acetylglucosamine--N-acetylmuramyl-(pentapeptide) pyrophosphoryl-undecaprenol N-acetylglucosamine transferase [Candidatus Kapaibacteriales bacterium]